MFLYSSPPLDPQRPTTTPARHDRWTLTLVLIGLSGASRDTLRLRETLAAGRYDIPVYQVISTRAVPVRW